MIQSCPDCGSSKMVHIGALGNLVWFRCLSCGMDSAQTDSELPTFEFPEHHQEETTEV